MLSHASRVENYLLLFALFLSMLSAGGCVRRNVNAVRSATNVSTSTGAININIATAGVLEALPNIGPTLAQRIVEFRAMHGPFRRPEHLLLVQGISEKRFREIRTLIRTE